MDPHAALELLEYLRICYPIFLLLLFAVAFIANAMVAARRSTSQESVRMGPGGRPLPKRHRNATPAPIAKEFSPTAKRFFNWLSVGVLVTFLIDATIFILHVMQARSEHWWRGQSAVVGLPRRATICDRGGRSPRRFVLIRYKHLYRFTLSAPSFSTPSC